MVDCSASRIDNHRDLYKLIGTKDVELLNPSEESIVLIGIIMIVHLLIL